MPVLEVREVFEEDAEGNLPASIQESQQTPRAELLAVAAGRPVARVWLSTVGGRRVCRALQAAFTLYCRQVRIARRYVGRRCINASILPDCKSCGLTTGSWCDECEAATCTICEHIGCRLCGCRSIHQGWDDGACRQFRNNSF